MKGSVFNKPRDSKGWIMILVILLLTAMGNWPVIVWVESPYLYLFGLNLGVAWSYVVVVATCIALNIFELVRSDM